MPTEAQLASTKCQASDQDANTSALWCAVIQRAITDLHDKSVGRIQREEALSWIRDDPGFAEVCDLAGVDAVVTREGILRKLRLSEQARATEQPIASPAAEIPVIAMPPQSAISEGVPA
jgi:hypothetical protein